MRPFSRLSVIILDEDRNRLAKRCQVTGYVFKRLTNNSKHLHKLKLSMKSLTF